jgi:hypothetical protein
MADCRRDHVGVRWVVHGRPLCAFADSHAFSDTVSITVVAPSDTVRRVRFRPDGLVFKGRGGRMVRMGLQGPQGDWRVLLSDAFRLRHRRSHAKPKNNSWSQRTRYVVGLLQLFANYAVAW